MARTLATTVIIKESDSDYDSDTTTIQLSFAEAGVSVAKVSRVSGAEIEASPASPIDLFPSNIPLTAGQRITMFYRAYFHTADSTTALRLLTWVADGAQVETNTVFGGGFSFDTSLTLDRAGTQAMTIDLFFRVD
jgi:hypothetical protein